MMKNRVIIIILILASVTLANALNVPKLDGFVNDKANILSSSEERKLENYLRQSEQKTSSQIVLLTIPSLEGENLEDYSMKVVETWKLGQKDLDNGVLLLISMQEKKIRFEIGYGLEGIITDLKAGYIIRNIMADEFRKGDTYGGISKGLGTVSELISGEFVISEEELASYNKNKGKKSGGHFPIGLLVFLFMIFSGGMRRGRGGIFTALLLGNMLGGGRSSGGFSSGGGFGGFSGGGGGFGGGGSSGGW